MADLDVSTEVSELQQVAARSMVARDFGAARSALAEAARRAPAVLEIWMSLAVACRADRAYEPALAAVDRALHLRPRDFLALLMRASLLERTAGERVAAPAYGAALAQAPAEAVLNEPTRRTLSHARELNTRYGAELNAALRASLDGLALSARGGRRGEVFIDRLTGRKRRYEQEPLGYAYPGLPAIEFWDIEFFPWIGELEAQAGAIRAEMLAVGYDDPDLTPYIDFPDHEPVDQWAELNRSMQWTALHLLQHGRRIEANCARCPATVAALAAVPQPVAVERSPSAMFSVLKPRTRIPPHTGVSNTRLVAHLALTVPAGCGFRVGAETRSWREGEAWVFDDTIEHEAWNDSDLPRGVLIFDVWNPLIPQDEREAIGRVMAAMDVFNAPPAYGS